MRGTAWLGRAAAALGWASGLLFGLLAASMSLHRSWARAAALFMLALACLPPTGAILSGRVPSGRGSFIRAAAIAALLALLAALVVGARASSIYTTPETRTRLLAIDDDKMSAWPVPLENRFVDTQYGRIHIVASGPANAPPLLLLHASGVSSWSWRYNIAALSERYRCCAIDLIGDAGQSEYKTLGHVLRDGRDQADLYAAIADRLGIDRAFVVGASEGGFTGSNYALHYPHRVVKLALLGRWGTRGRRRPFSGSRSRSSSQSGHFRIAPSRGRSATASPCRPSSASGSGSSWAASSR